MTESADTSADYEKLRPGFEKWVSESTVHTPNRDSYGFYAHEDVAEWWKVWQAALFQPQPSPSQPVQVNADIDWKDQYEKQKRRAEMWIAKYEKDIGPLEKVYPAAPLPQPQGERSAPKFPIMLRKMWSGGEVQDWINANWTGQGEQERKGNV